MRVEEEQLFKRDIINKIKMMATLFKAVVATGFEFIVSAVRKILPTVKTWLQSKIEPPVQVFISACQDFLLGQNNPELSTKYSTAKKEKKEIDKKFDDVQNKLSKSDLGKCDQFLLEYHKD